MSLAAAHATITGSGELNVHVDLPADGTAWAWFERDRRCMQALTSNCVAVEVPGVGDRAFLRGQSITVLKGQSIIKIRRQLHPAPPDDDAADLVQLAQAVAQRF